MTDAAAPQRILVTGASGFLGRALVQAGVARDRSVCALLRAGSAASEHEGVEEVRLDQPDWRERIAAFAPEAVFHTAAWSGAQHRPEDVDAIITANISLGTALLELAASMDRKPAFVWAGSWWQFADGGDQYAPQNLYAASKQAFAAIAEHYRRNSKLPVTGLILHDVYGEKDPRGRLLSLIAKTLDEDGATIDLTPGDQPLSFVHVDDVVEAFFDAARLVTEGQANAAMYAVAGPSGPLRQQIDMLLRPEDDASKLRWGKRSAPAGPAPQLTTVPTLPGWAPAISLDEGFQRLRRHG